MANSPGLSPLFVDLKRVSGLIEQDLQKFLDIKVTEAEKVDPQFGKTVSLLRTFMMRRGKAIRPFLTWCSYMLSGGKDEDAIIHIGSGVETNHYFILNLDDMADRDVVRHGGPTVELMYREQLMHLDEQTRNHYGRSLSEIMGELLHTYAYEMVLHSGFTPDIVVDVIGMLDKKMFEDPVIGWLIHYVQNTESIEKSSEERYLKGLQYVSAQYTFVGPLLTGLACSGASQEYKTALAEYGLLTGTAFQLHDDVLGVFGNEQETGKAAGNDIREGKKTLLIQRAYREASVEDKAFLNNVVGSNLDKEELEKVKSIIKDSGALEYSQQLAQEYAEKGKAALETITTPETQHYIDCLRDLADFVITRDK